MYFPTDDHLGLEVTSADLRRLDPGEMINDTIIDLFIRCAGLAPDPLLQRRRRGSSGSECCTPAACQTQQCSVSVQLLSSTLLLQLFHKPSAEQVACCARLSQSKSASKAKEKFTNAS